MKGIYILQIRVNREFSKKIGSLGMVRFERGIYLYIGSAQNSLESRIQRHRSRRKKKFWHIDYLLNSRYVKISDVFFKRSRKFMECRIANILNKMGKPVLKFGCSDCKCKSHLIRMKSDKINILALGMKYYDNVQNYKPNSDKPQTDEG